MNAPPSLEVRARFRRGGFFLDAELTLPTTGVMALTGYEGSGKTTLLRLISGWLRPDSGRIAFDGSIWHDHNIHVPPHRRPVAMVFQDRRLIAHLNVTENLSFAAAHAHLVDGPERNEVIQTFGLDQLLTRPATGLSGGERLRVALAQCLLARPRLVLLDEALTGLSRRSRSIILPWLNSLTRRFPIAIVAATHDICDITGFARIAILMDSGKTTTVGTPENVVSQMDSLQPDPITE